MKIFCKAVLSPWLYLESYSKPKKFKKYRKDINYMMFSSFIYTNERQEVT